ncbi:MAG: NAD(+)/NADH kinase [Delftia sp.]|nr:NAD(+)/NADH kinase [Delftia sp.]
MADFIGQRGIAAWLASTWDEPRVRDQVQDLDLALVLGGDGSTLRTARMVARHGVPIVGLNMGRLGFLSELTPDDWRDKLPRILDGDYWIEERLMLHAQAQRQGNTFGEYEALNDVVISRGSLARLIRVRAHIDGGHLATFSADGVIVSTPTGSTAYALAVGGPIMPPELHNILLIPIAPHLSLERAIVLSEGAIVDLGIGTDHEAILTVDGQFAFALDDGDRVIVHASPHLARFARVQERTYFYKSLMTRLRPGSDESQASAA